MSYHDFYRQQAEMFSFYRVPKVLFTDEQFSSLSTDAKLLYGILLDRVSLSARNRGKRRADMPEKIMLLTD